MSGVNYHLNHSQTGSAEKDRLGIPGTYYAAKKVAAGTNLMFTGSDYGYGAILIGNAAATANTKIHTINGETIDGNDLLAGTIYEIAPQKIVADTGDVFALKRLK
jgi:hypothetical protein|tara:strand:+ start:9400 stop:9714 length:315 start_codon:yes stop_codon:yes gene_type:complete